jgi:hypothetical protein
VFVWKDGATIRATRGPVWTNITTRSAGTALTRLNTTAGRGLIVNNVAITNGPAQFMGTFVGSICSNAASTIDYIIGGAASGGTQATLNVWNMYNRRSVTAYVMDNGASYTYATNTWRQPRASATNKCVYLYGLAEDEAGATYTAGSQTAAAAGADSWFGIGVDSITSHSDTGARVVAPTAAVFRGYINASYDYYPAYGQHYFSPVEAGDGTNTNTFGAFASTFSPALACRLQM